MATAKEIFSRMGDGLKEVLSSKKTPPALPITKPTESTSDVSGELDKGTAALKGKTKKQQAIDDAMKGS